MMICLRILTCLSTGEPMAVWRIVIRNSGTQFMELLQQGLTKHQAPGFYIFYLQHTKCQTRFVEMEGRSLATEGAGLMFKKRN